MRRIAHLIGIALTVSTCLPAGRAAAQEYCVTCSEPNALYRCVIQGAQPGGGQSLQMFCITTMAKQGGHATCSVKRGTVFDCDGAVKRIPWVALETSPHASDPPAQPLPWASQPPPKPEPAATPAPAPPALAPPTPPASAPDKPPETVLEMAKRANEDTAKQMKKAGDTVKKAGDTVVETTKKTWDCVISFFSRC